MRSKRVSAAGIMAAAVAAGLCGRAVGQTTTTIISDGFTNGTAGNSLVGGSPDTTDVPGTTYAQNGAVVFPITYANVGGTAYASVGADSGAAIGTGVTATVAYQVSTTFNNDFIGDTAGTLQRGEGLGFFSSVSSGYNGYHGVGNFTGVIVSPAGDVRIVAVGPQGTNEPTVNLVSDYVVPGYDNTLNHTLSYTANTSSGLITNVLLDGTAVPVTDTTPLVTPGNTAYVGFTASGNAGGQVALFNNFVVTTTPVVGPIPPSAWAVNASGDWNVASNWTTGVPNGVGAEADLTAALTANHTLYTDTPITLTRLVFNNSSASYAVTGAVGASLTMQASSGSAMVAVLAGTHKVNLPLTIASNTTLNVSTGATLLVSDPVTVNPGMSLNSSGGGTVTYQSTVTLGAAAAMSIASPSSINALTLGTSAKTTLATTTTGARDLLQVTGLSLATGAKLDLTNNALVVHGGSLAAVTALAQSGYASGTNAGPGLVSSTAAAAARHLTTVGVIANTSATGTALYGSGTTLGLFQGSSPAAGDVLARFTYYGDANLDGKVDGQDYGRLDAGFASQSTATKLTGWYNGDFNYDGKVDGSDYTLTDNAFNLQGNNLTAPLDVVTPVAAPAGELAAVPEPASAGLIAAATAGLLAVHRRR